MMKEFKIPYNFMLKYGVKKSLIFNILWYFEESGEPYWCRGNKYIKEVLPFFGINRLTDTLVEMEQQDGIIVKVPGSVCGVRSGYYKPSPKGRKEFKV